MKLELYNGKINLEFREASHRYYVNNKQTVGVTTILNTLSKDLMGWAAMMAVNAFKESVKPFVHSDDKMSVVALNEAAKLAKSAYMVKSQHGMDVGTIVHNWIHEEVLAGGIIEVPRFAVDLLKKAGENKEIFENITIARHCVEQWRQWCIDYDVEFLDCEKVVYSAQLDYCGTFDVRFRSRRTGKTYVGDYKTSEPQKIRNGKYQIIGSRAYPEHFMQTIAYDYAYSDEFPGVTTDDDYMVIYLPKESRYACYSRPKLAGDFQAWAGLVAMYRWLGDERRRK